MDSQELVKSIARSSPSKIVLLVIDGLGGLPAPETGKTELETAKTPNLDRLAAEGVCGLSDPVGRGITPGSVPGHLALFGYDPVRYDIGRGVLEAVGIDFLLEPGDVAARGNFCTVDEAGIVTDRRAGRISNGKGAELCRLLDGQVIDETEVIVQPTREHRFIVVFRGRNIFPGVSDSDPQQVGAAPLEISTLSSEAGKLATVANQFIAGAKSTLSGHSPANMVLLRGFSKKPDFPSMSEIYRLKPAAIAGYPMYRGLAGLIGMDILETDRGIVNKMKTLSRHYGEYDFFFVHIKTADTAGEDGDFERKVDVIEEVDGSLRELIGLQPDVIVVTGDHSTPALLKGHSWHPVPVLINSRWCRADGVKEFSESACIQGGLGTIPATQIMPLAMANALKLNKFGA